MPRFGETTPKMDELWKTHPNPEIMKDMIREYRASARDHLQTSIPQAILRLRKLIKAESDPSSPLWIGHTKTGQYVPEGMKLYQPTDLALRELGIEAVKPDQVATVMLTRAAKGNSDGCHVPTDGDDGEVEVEDEVIPAERQERREGSLIKAGDHWFEILPGNETQREASNILEDEVDTLYFTLQDLKTWLSLEIPIIEDGNSFGAEVQDHLLHELDDGLRKCLNMQGSLMGHFSDRAKYGKDWCMYPGLKDIPAMIAKSDRYDHMLIRSNIRLVLMYYSSLLVRFERNWAKVINPKGQGGGGAEGMY